MVSQYFNVGVMHHMPSIDRGGVVGRTWCASVWGMLSTKDVLALIGDISTINA